MADFWTAPHLPLLQHQLVGAALVVWLGTALWRSRSYRVWWPQTSVLLACMLTSGAVFARLLSLLAGDTSGPWWNPLGPGYSSFGLFAGAALAVVVFSRVARVSLGRLVDIIVPSSLLALAIVRTGCLFRGCDFGGPSGWGIRYAAESPVTLIHPAAGVTESAVLHPLPMYLGAAAALGAVVAILASRTSSPGRSLVGAAFYLTIRACVEPLRSSESTWHWLDINANVIFSIVAAMACIAAWKAIEKHESGLSGT